MSDDAWVGLFSGGKDSSWAVYRGLERGLSTERLLTVHPDEDSFLFHAPATDLAALASEAIGIPQTTVDARGYAGDDATERGDAELEPLADALATLDDELGGLAGVTVGAVASTYQADRVERVCDDIGCDVFAPLWGVDPVPALRSMLDAGFDVRIVAVAAAGLDESWLGRRIDGEAVDELAALQDAHGVHPLGEGGEFETFVTDGPHMDRSIEIDYATEWDGTRGRLLVEDVRLVD